MFRFHVQKMWDLVTMKPIIKGEKKNEKNFKQCIMTIWFDNILLFFIAIYIYIYNISCDLRLTNFENKK